MYSPQVVSYEGLYQDIWDVCRVSWDEYLKYSSSGSCISHFFVGGQVSLQAFLPSSNIALCGSVHPAKIASLFCAVFNLTSLGKEAATSTGSREIAGTVARTLLLLAMHIISLQLL